MKLHLTSIDLTLRPNLPFCVLLSRFFAAIIFWSVCLSVDLKNGRPNKTHARTHTTYRLLQANTPRHTQHDDNRKINTPTTTTDQHGSLNTTTAAAPTFCFDTDSITKDPCSFLFSSSSSSLPLSPYTTTTCRSHNLFRSLESELYSLWTRSECKQESCRVHHRCHDDDDSYDDDSNQRNRVGYSHTNAYIDVYVCVVWALDRLSNP